MRGAGNLRIDLPVHDRDRSLEYASHNALLSPHLAGLQLAVRVKARQLGAGPGPARRSVVGLSRTEDEVAALSAGGRGRAEQFDMINLFAAIAADAARGQSLADSPRELGQLVEAVHRQGLAVAAHQEEPVAAPGDIAGDFAERRDVDRHAGGRAVARDVADPNAAIGEQL